MNRRRFERYYECFSSFRSNVNYFAYTLEFSIFEENFIECQKTSDWNLNKFYIKLT